MRQAIGVEAQWHQRRAWRHDLEAKLFGDLVAERRGTDFWYRQATRCDDECWRIEVALRCPRDIAFAFVRHAADDTAHAHFHLGAIALCLEHIDDEYGAIVAK